MPLVKSPRCSQVAQAELTNVERARIASAIQTTPPKRPLEFLKQKSAEPKKKVAKGSRLAGQLNRNASVQIALRLPGPDIEKARELATRKGIGYQTLLKMLVHEGLRREARRA